MASSTTTRRLGLTGQAALKSPVKAATTANITLSGLQFVDGYSAQTGDRILVKNQSAQTDNGIYVADSGAWTRDLDFDGPEDILQGTLVLVLNGATNGNELWQVTTTTTIVFGTTAITFAQQVFAGAGTVGSVSVVTANGVSGSVANPTTTPAITLTLGAITPSSVASVGAVSGTALSGSSVTSTGIIKTTGSEGNQFQLILGAQEWDVRMVSGGAFYVADVTNLKSPFVISPNTSNSLTIGTASIAFVGAVTMANGLAVSGGAFNSRMITETGSTLNLTLAASAMTWEVDQNAATSVAVKNTTNGAASLAFFGATSDVAALSFTAHASARIVTRMGIAVGGFVEFGGGAAGNGMMIDTRNATPIYMGTNDTLALTIDSSQNVLINGGNFIPNTNGVPSLGAASKGFRALYLDYTNTATVGNVIINKASGTVNMAALASTLTLTNSLITAASHLMITLASDPGVALACWTVCGAGSATINTRPATVNQTAIDFVLVNAD